LRRTLGWVRTEAPLNSTDNSNFPSRSRGVLRGAFEIAHDRILPASTQRPSDAEGQRSTPNGNQFPPRASFKTVPAQLRSCIASGGRVFGHPHDAACIENQRSRQVIARQQTGNVLLGCYFPPYRSHRLQCDIVREVVATRREPRNERKRVCGAPDGVSQVELLEFVGLFYVLSVGLDRNPPRTPDEWLRLLQVQEQLHAKEMKTWQKVIQSSIDLLRKVREIQRLLTKSSSMHFQTEQSLSELQNLILTQRAKNSAERVASVAEFFTTSDEIS
jgi:hypothetical protein